MKIIITRNENNEIFYNDKQIKVNPQASKGPNNEVVDLDSLHDTNLAQYQRYISLSKLNVGDNEIELKPRKDITLTSLTKEEEAEIAELEARIKEIKENAKLRKANKPDLNVDPSKMTEEEKQAKIAEILKYYNLKM